MLPVAPYLTVRRPSPTTAEFTVTTAPPPTLASRLLLAVTIPLRLLLASAGLLALRAALFDYLPSLSLPPSLHASAAALAAVPRPAAAASGLAALWLAARRTYATETLLVLRGLGVQTRSEAGSYLAGAATRFIATDRIRDVLVNEAFFNGGEVRYYLVVVVEGEEDVVVVFPGLLPGLDVVRTVWRGVKGCLYENVNKV
jgi:phosphatidylinositol N-acetylglucosaminyltransferase subunit H